MALPVELSLESVQLRSSIEGVEIHAALSEPWHVDVSVLWDDAALDLTQVVGTSAALSLAPFADVERISGLVATVEQRSAEPTGLSRYRVRIVPPAWLATRTRDHRIFQHRSPLDVVAELYRSHGQAVRPVVSDRPAEREYIVQYGESNHDFCRRLLAEEGLLFYFDMESGELVVTDDSRAAMGPRIELPFRHALNDAGARHAFEVRRAASVVASRIARTDFDPKKPKFSVRGEASDATPLPSEGELEIHHHEPAQFVDETRGKRVADFDLSALRASGRVLEVKANLIVFPGSEVSVHEHPFPETSAALLVTSAEARLWARDEATELDATISAQAKAILYRSQRIPKPVLAGTHTALVVGEAGQEIDVDEEGRVVLAFPWDRRGLREGAPTRRVRVSQAWAGPGSGLMALPRIGDEVLVSYLDGDPDEPLVVGRVHNGVNRPPLDLPADKTKSVWRTRSSPGGDGENHLLFEDKAGEELVEIFGQKDLRVRALHDCDIQYGNDHRQSVGNNHHIKVFGDQFVEVTGSQATKVGANVTVESATYAVKSGPTSVDGTTVSIHGSASIAGSAPDIALMGGSTFSASAPLSAMAGTAQATVSAPLAVISGTAIAVLQGGAIMIKGATIAISGDSTININSGGYVNVSAPTVNVTGEATVTVAAGGNVNLSGGAGVNLTGGVVKIN